MQTIPAKFKFQLCCGDEETLAALECSKSAIRIDVAARQTSQIQVEPVFRKGHSEIGELHNPEITLGGNTKTSLFCSLFLQPECTAEFCKIYT